MLYTLDALVSRERILIDSSEKNKSRLPMGTLHPGKQASLLAVFIIALAHHPAIYLLYILQLY